MKVQGRDKEGVGSNTGRGDYTEKKEKRVYRARA